ncbi:hypothetical protein [Thermus scotoductus]|uniref:hypothetical protein n=1 Tax=Thermus scotoductus TaxID=37636 RepID=UPI0015623945|nr:hypothetical protein [Thermus scotoductus]
MRKVRNQYGVESVVPDDYPESLIQQLGLEVVEVLEDEPAQPETQPEEEKPRRRR